MTKAFRYSEATAPDCTVGVRLNVCVIFTSVKATLTALKEVGILAARLNGRITVLAPHVVPYALPLERPAVLPGWNARRFHVLACASPVETEVRELLCRDRVPALLAALSPHSLVVVAGKGRWWPNADRRLARRLSRAGHEVIFKEMDASNA